MKPKKRSKLRSSAISKSPSPKKIHQLLSLYNSAKRVEAEKLARTMAKSYPRHDVAWQVLGALLIQQEKPEAAIVPLIKAAHLLPNEPAVLCNLGLALMKAGRLNEAEENLRQSLTLEPEQNEALNNLGLVLHKKGKANDAEICFRKAIELNSHDARTLVNLGNALGDLGHASEAEACYRQALDINPTLSMALNQLAMLMASQNKQSLALEFIIRSLQIEKNQTNKTYFINIVKKLRFSRLDLTVQNYLVEALTVPWGTSISATVAHALHHSPDIGPAIDRALRAWPQRLPGEKLFGTDDFVAITNNPLLLAYLISDSTYGVPMERFLTMARYVLLEIALQSDLLTQEDANSVLNFASALAQQCFINEYLHVHTDDEIKQATALRNELAVAKQDGTTPALLRLMAVASYFPLHSLPDAEQLLEITEPAAVVAVLRQQIYEPLVEQQLRDTIPCLTSTDEGISRSVRSMYEENPYPRWVKTTLPNCMSIDQYTHVTFPLASPQPLGKKSTETDILIAGCGTGKHSIVEASRFCGARFLAIDLSLNSLSYAKRKTEEMGIGTIEYAQADIIKMAETNRRFDVIQSSGVLHHLADPWAGWQVLLSLLRPGGLMKLGFYSKIGRRKITFARTYIAENNYGSTPEEIRRCRQDLLEHSKTRNLGLAVSSNDFFSTSACRDLLFHVQEHHMTLPEIAAFLQEHTLRFLGFEIDQEILGIYHQKFPEDLAATNLKNWHAFEEENPDIFIDMYQFWVQKQ